MEKVIASNVSMLYSGISPQVSTNITHRVVPYKIPKSVDLVEVCDTHF